jgi:60S ribosome subunit biogenesis protein NIP7
MKFRELTEKEKKVIRKAFNFFGIKNRFTILATQGREVHAMSKDLNEFIRSHNLTPVSAGLKIGEVGRRFRFSIEGSFLVKSKRKRVYVSRKGEMLFLYGRDIFAESVVKVTDDVRENDIVFVTNTKGDIIGIGKSRFDCLRMRSAEKDRVVVENLVDRGEYLRKEKLYNSY